MDHLVISAYSVLANLVSQPAERAARYYANVHKAARYYANIHK